MVSNIGVTLTGIGIIAGAIYYRLSNLETRRDREQYLVSKFEDRQWIEEPLVAKFDTLNVIEATGLEYSLRRYLFGQFDGNVTVSLTCNFSFDEEMWDHEELMKPYHDITDCDVEFIGQETFSSGDVQLAFRIDSIDYDEIAHVLLGFLGFLKAADEYVDGVSLGFQQRK